MFKTPEDLDALDEAMASKTRAQARRIAAQASCFELAGWSGVFAASGLAIWLGSLAYVKYNGENAKERAFIERVAATPLKVEVVAKLADGTQVQLASGGQVTLAKGGMVGVSPDSTLRLAPDSTVRAVGDAPRPTPAQIQADARPASGAPVVSNFVIFKESPYAKGDVVTGWRFADSSQTNPSGQWCQYREPQPDGTLRLVTIAKDGQRVGLPTPSPFPSVDLQRAFNSCTWADAHAPVNPPSPHVISARAK
jgi:hypothetical protein